MDFVWDGTLSPMDFHFSALAFMNKWKRSSTAFPLWLWNDCRKHSLASQQEADGYLSMEKFFHIRNEEIHNKSIFVEEKDGNLMSNGRVDDATVVGNCQDEVIYFDLHILYSPTYRLPVLFFRAYKFDGQPLMLCEVEKSLPACTMKRFLESRWTFITQEEHPQLKRPWFKIHPCGTCDWMKLLLGDSSFKKPVIMEQYLVSWFSVVGQVVGVHTPLDMIESVVQGGAVSPKPLTQLMAGSELQ